MMILHAPHSILKTANTHVPNLISDLQSNKNEGKKGQRHLDKGISHLCTLETEVCLHLVRASVRWGKELQNRYHFSHP